MRAERTLQPEEHCYINASLSHSIFAFRIILKLTNISLNKIYVQKKSSIPLGDKRKIWNIRDKPRIQSTDIDYT